jgi:hypothetical protein
MKRRRTKQSAQRSFSRSDNDVQPADVVVTRLFSDLQLAEYARTYTPEKAEVAKSFERQAWRYLISYLLTLERPPIRI